MNKAIERWLVDNPGHRLEVETYFHPPIPMRHGGTEWFARIRDDGTPDFVLAEGSGLVVEDALWDLNLQVQNWIDSIDKR